MIGLFVKLCVDIRIGYLKQTNIHGRDSCESGSCQNYFSTVLSATISTFCNSINTVTRRVYGVLFLREGKLLLVQSLEIFSS